MKYPPTGHFLPVKCMHRMKTILVTGAAGFIGMHVARRVLERGDAVAGIDNLDGTPLVGQGSY